SEHRGSRPVELTGGVRFPRIGDLSYLLTLPGHGFYWFQLVDAGDDSESR
ncbi:alpha-glucosidase C-terminal domain-containing protein, partial [Saccharothrix sp. MB29]|nr:alpha-glucosidase C-terminal domain-containing protein [Saccharothrix sp. MB29]